MCGINPHRGIGLGRTGTMGFEWPSHEIVIDSSTVQSGLMGRVDRRMMILWNWLGPDYALWDELIPTGSDAVNPQQSQGKERI